MIRMRSIMADGANGYSSMANIYLVFILLLPAASDIHHQPAFYSLNKQLDYLEAVRSCNSLPGKWSLPDSFQHIEVLSSIMQNDGIRRVWLGIRKFTFTSWRWVDGTFFNSSETVFGEQSKTKSCGVLYKNATLWREECTHQGVGFICELPGKKPCPTSSCFRQKGFLLQILCQSASWYNSREYCVQRGGNLLILDILSKIKIAANAINDNICPDNVTAFFIGLHKEDWISVVDSKRNTDTSRLALDDEEFHENQCAVLTLEKFGQFILAFQRCISGADVICQSYESANQVFPYTTDSSTSSEGEKEGQKTMVILAIVISVLIVIALACGTIVLIYKWYRKQKKSRKHFAEETQEMEKLLGLSLSEERVAILNNNLERLLQRIELDGSNLLRDLVTKQVLTEANRTHIKECKDKPAVWNLIDILSKKSNTDFEQFCDTLQENGQGNVVKEFLLTEYDYKVARSRLHKHIEDYCDIQLLTSCGFNVKKKIGELFTNMIWLHSYFGSSVYDKETFFDFSKIFGKIQSYKDTAVIVTGIAGGGKTTFAKRIMKEFQQNFDDILVLPITLRFVSKEKNIFQLLRSQISSLSDLSLHAIINLLESADKEKWIILDGYDELLEKSFINNNLLNHSYPKTTVFITTRPNLVITISHIIKKHNQQLVEIEGFSKTQIKEYISVYFHETPERKKIGLDLYNDLMNGSVKLLRFAKIPIWLEVICNVWSDEKSLSKTLVEMYTILVKGMFSHLAQKQNSISKNDEEFFPYKSALGKLANTWKGESVIQNSFSEDELKDCFGDLYSTLLRSGFLVKFHPSRERSELNWSFSHPILQEYFIAFNLSDESLNYPMIKFAGKCTTINILERMKMVVGFLCGFNPIKANDFLTLIVDKFTGPEDSRRLLPFLLDMLPQYKSKHQAKFPLPWNIEVTDKLDMDAFNILLRKDPKDNKNKIEKLVLTGSAIAQIATNIDPSCLSNISEVSMEIKDKEATNFATAIIREATTVKSVEISCGMDKSLVDAKLVLSIPKEHLSALTVEAPGAMKTLAPVLAQCPSLKSLTVKDEGKETNPSGTILFCEAVNKCNQLEYLNVTTMKFCTSFLILKINALISFTAKEVTYTCLDEFTRSLQSAYKDVSSKISKFNILNLQRKQGAGMKNVGNFLAEILLRLTTLRELAIDDFDIVSDTIYDMCSSLFQEGSKLILSRLSISNNFLGGSGENLENLLNLLPTLTSLNLSNSGLSADDFSQLARLRQNHESIRDLNLSKNNIFGNKLSIGDIFSCFPFLETLDISECGIVKHNLVKVFSAIKSSTIEKLKTFKLNYNFLSNEGLSRLSSIMPSLSSLVCLELASCGVDDVHVLSVLLQALSPSIEVLVIKDNDFGDEVVYIVRCRDALSHLKMLSIGTFEQDDERETIKNALQEVDIEIFY